MTPCQRPAGDVSDSITGCPHKHARAQAITSGTATRSDSLGSVARRSLTMKSLVTVITLIVGTGIAVVAGADALPPDATYRPLPTAPLDAVIKTDQAAKPQVMQRQRSLLAARYDLSDRPIAGMKMSGGRKSVQGGVR